MAPPKPDHAYALQVKFTKWLMFTIGLVIVTAGADMFAAVVNKEPLSLGKLFGRGELFMVSIGLLIAASADLVFDRLVKGGGQIYHGVVLAFCVLLTLPVAVAYGSAKIDDTPSPQPAAMTISQDDKRTRRAELSLYILLGSAMLSGVGVYISEKGGRSASS